MNENLYELKEAELDLIKCEICDEHLRKRFMELKEYIYRIYKNFIQINRSVKFKEETKTFATELEETKNKYFEVRTLILKIIEIKKHINDNNNSLSGLKVINR